MTTKSLLQRAGEALYGSRWQTELSRALGIADRTMRRWVAEPDNVPGTVWVEIEKLIADRKATFEILKIQIKRAQLVARSSS